MRTDRGFTLIEVIVVAGIIAILAGILVPIIFKEIDEAKITRASADIRSLSSSIIVFRRDTGKWPVLDSACDPSIPATSVRGQGNEPSNAAAMGFDLSRQEFYNNHLPVDAYGCYPGAWKGPYIALVSADPWGNAYLTNAKNFDDSPPMPVWILSAGPNGELDTNAADGSPGGDDVGLRLQ